VAWQTTPLALIVLTAVALLTVGAAARITRLFTEDTITRPLRDYLTAKADDRWDAPDESPPGSSPHLITAPRAWRWLAKLIRCPWCLGFWVSALLVGAYFLTMLDTPPWHSPTAAFAYLVATFATSQAVGLAADWLDSPPPVRTLQLLPTHVTVRDDQPST